MTVVIRYKLIIKHYGRTVDDEKNILADFGSARKVVLGLHILSVCKIKVEFGCSVLLITWIPLYLVSLRDKSKF